MTDFVENDVRDALIAQLLTIPENKVSCFAFCPSHSTPHYDYVLT